MQSFDNSAAIIMIAIATTSILSGFLEYYSARGEEKRGHFHQSINSDNMGFGSWYGCNINTLARVLAFHGLEHSAVSILFIGLVLISIPNMQLEIICILIVLAVGYVILGVSYHFRIFRHSRA